MDTKLTIKLSKRVIDEAKDYAKNNRTSLSRLIEDYLDVVTNKEVRNYEITPLVKSLSGVITLPKDFDYKQDLLNFPEGK